jgi:hypothetical protein
MASEKVNRASYTKQKHNAVERDLLLFSPFCSIKDGATTLSMTFSIMTLSITLKIETLSILAHTTEYAVSFMQNVVYAECPKLSPFC